MRYRPDLDGLRAIAVLTVLASHTDAPIAAGGWMGVDVFFVLSGFLITRLILVERVATGAVSLRRFYGRRALRLVPALVLVLVGFSPFYASLAPDRTFANYLLYAAIAGFYLFDFVTLFDPTLSTGLGHTWSLAVEEQFYLLWPPLLCALQARGKDPLKWIVGLTVAGWAVLNVSMFWGYDGSAAVVYTLPWDRFSQLLAGCALAVVVAQRPVPGAVATWWFGWLGAVAGASLVFVAGHLPRSPNLSWQAPAIALVTVAFVWHLEAGRATVLRSVLSCRPIVWLGRRSYGVYLFHYPILLILAKHVAASRLTVVSLMLVLTVGLAALSYRFLELPFLRLKSRLQPQTPVTAEAAA